MTKSDAYVWQATQKNGLTFDRGDDLRNAVRVAFTSATLPSHEFIGLDFIRRFGRGYIRAAGGYLVEYVHCVVCASCRIYVYSSNGRVLITPADYELYI